MNQSEIAPAIAEAEAVYAQEESERRERRGAAGGWLMSFAIHGAVLLMLTLVVIIQPLVVDQPVVRTAIVDRPAPEVTPPQQMSEPVEVEITVETTAATVVEDLALPTLFDIEFTSVDAAATGEVANREAAAIGAGGGGGGAGGIGAFAAGGSCGDGGAGFFGVGDGSGASARRVLYIIDMSRSLKEPQIGLIKDRLLNSLADLKRSQRFEVLFFSGPVWQLGDDEIGIRDNWLKGRNHHDYSVIRDMPQGEWRAYPPSVRSQVESYVMDQLETTGGTDWRHPFSIAFDMETQPDVIYFLTDGKVDNSELTLDIIDQKQPYSPIPINTIAFGLDDKDGVATLEQMSRDSGGDHIAYTMEEIERLYEQMLKEGRRR